MKKKFETVEIEFVTLVDVVTVSRSEYEGEEDEF